MNRSVQIMPFAPPHRRFLERGVRRRVGPAAVRKLEQQLGRLEYPTAYAAYNAVTALASTYHGQNRLKLELLGGQFLDAVQRIERRVGRGRSGRAQPSLEYQVR